MAEKEGEKKELSNLEKTLLRGDFQQIVGTNVAKSDPTRYGSFGLEVAEPAYDNVMQSEAIAKVRNAEYQNKKAEYQSRGVFGDPAYLSNPEVSNLVMKQIDEQMSIASLGELYNVIKKIAPGLDFKIPEQLKGLSQTKLMQSAIEKKALTDKGLDAKKLSEDEQNAFALYQTLSSTYKEANVLNLLNAGVYGQANAVGNAIWEKYNPKPKEEAPKE
jgi:hypothetical protein